MLYQYTSLSFGIASAPAIFQKAMGSILQGLEYVIYYLDNILVTGTTDEEHMQNLDTVFRWLKEHGMRLNKEKCHIWQSSVDYLGCSMYSHRTSQGGHHFKGPASCRVSELRSFLGMINYYRKFIPNLSTIEHPLNALLKAGQ